MLARLFPGARLYLTIGSRRLHGLNTGNSRQFDDPPPLALERRDRRNGGASIGYAARSYEGRKDSRIINPFEYPRMLLGDFSTAGALLRQVVQALQPGLLQPTLVVDPVGRLEAGLSDME